VFTLEKSKRLPIQSHHLFLFSFLLPLNLIMEKKTPKFSHFHKCGWIRSFPQGPTLVKEENSGLRKNPCPKLLSLHVTHFRVTKHCRNSQSVCGGHFSCVNILTIIEKESYMHLGVGGTLHLQIGLKRTWCSLIA
jgi:hypothetical protein